VINADFQICSMHLFNALLANCEDMRENDLNCSVFLRLYRLTVS
jgi:predicted DNA-binding ribbon-helix-helix protein